MSKSQLIQAYKERMKHQKNRKSTWTESDYDDRSLGPSGLSDAHLLNGICNYIRPRLAIEYGGLLGHSLEVMAPHCDYIITVDVRLGDRLKQISMRMGNSRLVEADMKYYDPVKDGVPKVVDLVFVDASHLYEDDVAAYQNFKHVLSPEATVLVHDTGDWPTDNLLDHWKEFSDSREYFKEQDRNFVRFLREEGYSDVTFGTARQLRHGITVLQKRKW